MLISTLLEMMKKKKSQVSKVRSKVLLKTLPINIALEIINNIVEPSDDTNDDSLLVKTAKYLWSFVQPSASSTPSSDYKWRLFPDQNQAKTRLRRIETDLLEVTTKLNCKIIGEDVAPFVKHY